MSRAKKPLFLSSIDALSRSLSFSLSFGLMFSPSVCAPAQTAGPAQNSGPSDDLASMDLEKLMDIKVRIASLFSDKLSPFGDRTAIAVVLHANNLTNQVIWLPSGFSSVDTVPVQQGQDIFAGLELSLGKR